MSSRDEHVLKLVIHCYFSCVSLYNSFIFNQYLPNKAVVMGLSAKPAELLNIEKVTRYSTAYNVNSSTLSLPVIEIKFKFSEDLLEVELSL